MRDRGGADRFGERGGRRRLQRDGHPGGERRRPGMVGHERRKQARLISTITEVIVAFGFRMEDVPVLGPRVEIMKPGGVPGQPARIGRTGGSGRLAPEPPIALGLHNYAMMTVWPPAACSASSGPIVLVMSSAIDWASSGVLS